MFRSVIHLETWQVIWEKFDQTQGREHLSAENQHSQGWMV